MIDYPKLREKRKGLFYLMNDITDIKVKSFILLFIISQDNRRNHSVIDSIM